MTLNPDFMREAQRRVEVGLAGVGEAYIADVGISMGAQGGARTGNFYWTVRGSQGTELAVEDKYGDLAVFRTINGRSVLIRDDDLRRGRPHISSAPGQIPAKLTGQLAQRVGTRIDRSRDATTVYAGSNVPYAEALEKGNSRIAPRPMWRVVWDRKRDRYERLLSSITRRAVRGLAF